MHQKMIRLDWQMLTRFNHFSDKVWMYNLVESTKVDQLKYVLTASWSTKIALWERAFNNNTFLDKKDLAGARTEEDHLQTLEFL